MSALKIVMAVFKTVQIQMETFSVPVVVAIASRIMGSSVMVSNS